MRTFLFFGSIFLGVLAVYGAAIFLQGAGGLVPVTGFAHLIYSFIFMGMGIAIFRRTYLDWKANFAFFYFSLTFIFMGIFTFLVALPHLVVYGPIEMFPEVIHWGHLNGLVFFYVSLAFFALALAHIFARSLEKFVFAATLSAGAYLTVLKALLPAYPVFDEATGLTFFNQNPSVGLMLPLITIAVWLPGVLLFGATAIRTHKPAVRNRSILIALGLAIAMIAGPFHDVASTASQYFAADIIGLAGILIWGAGLKGYYNESVSSNGGSGGRGA